MNNKFAAAFAATALVGVTTAFAANPFSDVTPNSWAYQAVAQLANQGIVNGYPDGTFKGQNNITRYEVAQMVAKAMANQNRANAEQQAMINRLADEFSAELNNLGVRVSNLEDRVGNIKATGDVRLRYLGSKKNKNHENKYDAYGKHSTFDMRGRVQFNAKVNDKTSAVIRVTSGDMEFGDAKGNKSGDARFDQVYVAHKFGSSATLIGGRFPLMVGAGLAYDDNFDGAGLVLGNGKHVQGVLGYGSMVEGTVRDAELDAKHNARVWLAQAKVGNLEQGKSIGGFYLGVADRFDTGIKQLDGLKGVYGFNADYNINKIWVGGEWLKGKFDRDAKGTKATAWVAGLGYGKYDQAKAGTWDIKAQYFNQKKYAPIVSSTWNQAYDLSNSLLKNQNGYKGWMATVDYALADNVGLSGYYGFHGKNQDGQKVSDFYRAELNYKF
ncbi:MAG: S-layer homology domain-containing protein [Veillonella sp.]|nr:S-layer homology domain-containing protein [Veillonella sp.]